MIMDNVPQKHLTLSIVEGMYIQLQAVLLHMLQESLHSLTNGWKRFVHIST